MVTLLCTVRGCRSPLARDGRRLACERSHSFDVARSGYVNLLQPHERRSREPGDTREAVAARRRLFDRGLMEPLIAPMVELIGSCSSLLDVGCGEGYYLDAFRSAFGCEAHGTDISTAAVDLAARRYRECQFTVANADRFLPYESVDVITSITARVNPLEFARVAPRVLIALPAPDDLIELREAILGEAKRIDRTGRDFSPLILLKQSSVRYVARVPVADIMTSSYRGIRAKEQERLKALPQELDVTISRDLLLFRRDEGRRGAEALRC